jgi:cbb3-type cytochrome oxidase subunit 1
MHSRLGRIGSGAFVTMFTVRGSMTSMRAMVSSEDANTDFTAGSSARAMLNFTAFASSASPLWNLTPSRSWICHVVSLSDFHETARPGTSLPCRSRASSVS